MNLLLLDEFSEDYRIAPGHPRHESLARLDSGEVCVGVVGGPRGIGDLYREPDGVLRITHVCWEASPPPGPPETDLVVGLPRPAEVRRILFLAGVWGVRSVTFACFDRTPPGYRESRALDGTAADRVIREGVEQGFHTRVPRFGMVDGWEGVSGLAGNSCAVTVLDPYLGESLLGAEPVSNPLPGTLVFCGERGFSPWEQTRMRACDVSFRHLGPVIFRSGQAVATALPLAMRSSGFLDDPAGAQIKV